MARRVYVDTSVIGGVHDNEFSEYSERLIREFRLGFYIPVLSTLTLEELRDAPRVVRNTLTEVEEYAYVVGVTNDAIKLSRLYLSTGGFSLRQLADTLHIAVATVHGVEILASWNFRDIVNLEKISVYNSVNVKEGYHRLEIRSPREIIHEENI